MTTLQKAILFLILSVIATAQAESDKKDATSNFFCFGSVENAIEQLSKTPGAKIRETSSRTVISIEADRVKWEFPSKSQPYYPSIIRSQVLFINNQLDYQVNIACGAEKSKCDEMSKSYDAYAKSLKQKFSK